MAAARRQVSGGDPLWFKDAVIYEVHVRAFFDANDDGCGDFAGLSRKLEYIQDLGVNTIWLLPFYPSPGRDDGYDIADYHNIHPQYGTRAEFRAFVREAHRRNLRVITELVLNHTSDAHPWFQAARRAPAGSLKRNYYVWSDSPQRYAGTRIIFRDTESSNWAWDPEAKSYYWHRFFSHQPDLNFDNPHVLQAMLRIMDFWLRMGVDGFRLDAIPYLVEREGTNNENLRETHEIIRVIRRAVAQRYPDRMLLAEANQWPEDVRDYFGDGRDECQMAYHFPLMPRMYMAIAQEDRHPIVEIMEQTPDIPDTCQWAIFLRNHDELTLEMVTSRERDYMYQSYAADARARLNLGIRRRLAPLLDNDPERIKLMNSLLLSMPGAPIIYYGDEIGMGDNVFLGDRNGLRTPMQWSPDRNGGFSRADPARLYAPLIMDPVYGYEAVNVEAQSRSLSSLLSGTRRLISVRKSTLAFGRGTMTFIRPANRAVLAYVRQYKDEVILCVANLSRAAQATELDLSPWKDRIPLEMLGRTRFPAIGELPYMITLAPYGFYWFELQERDKFEQPAARVVPEFETLVVPLNSTWVSLARTRGVFEHNVLPEFLAHSRWYPERNPEDIQPTLTSAVPFCTIGDNRPWVAFFETTQHDVTSRYVLPMQIEWVRFDRERYNPQALAAVRQGAREGTLLDVAGAPIFIGLLLRNLLKREVVEESGVRLEFTPTARFADRRIREPERVHPMEGEARNTVSLVDHDYVVKIYRKLETGIHPEVELGRYLADVAGFANTPALLGSAELVEGDARSAIGVVHAYVENQGDGWAVSTAYLDRFVDEQRVRANGAYGQDSGQLAPYQRLMLQTGRRLAELHLALTAHPELPDFAPEPTRPDDVARWIGEATACADRVFDALRQRRDDLKEADQPLVDQLLSYRATLQDRLAALPPDVGGLNIRQHGDFHLGEILIVKDDIFIIDVEGDPRWPLAERRRKAPAARDVASLIRSIDYSVTTAIERARQAGVDDHGGLASALSGWRAGARTAFLAGYDEIITERRLWPTDPRASIELLNFFLLEKALIEIEYELSRRPDWLRVPLSATLRILSDPANEAS